MKQGDLQRHEKFVGGEFCWWFNAQYSTDYEVIVSTEEGNIGDLFFVSRSNRCPKIPVQLTSTLPKNWHKIDEIKIIGRVEYASDLRNSINSKLYDFGEMRIAILLLHGMLWLDQAETIINDQFCRDYQNSVFLGIYYLSPSIRNKVRVIKAVPASIILVTP